MSHVCDENSSQFQLLPFYVICMHLYCSEIKCHGYSIHEARCLPMLQINCRSSLNVNEYILCFASLCICRLIFSTHHLHFSSLSLAMNFCILFSLHQICIYFIDNNTSVNIWLIYRNCRSNPSRSFSRLHNICGHCNALCVPALIRFTHKSTNSCRRETYFFFQTESILSIISQHFFLSPISIEWYTVFFPRMFHFSKFYIFLI